MSIEWKRHGRVLEIRTKLLSTPRDKRRVAIYIALELGVPH